MEPHVDQEHLSVHVLYDLDVPHMRLPQLMATAPAHYADRRKDHRAFLLSSV